MSLSSVPKMRGEDLAGLGADLAYAEGAEQARKAQRICSFLSLL